MSDVRDSLSLSDPFGWEDGYMGALAYDPGPAFHPQDLLVHNTSSRERYGQLTPPVDEGATLRAIFTTGVDLERKDSAHSTLEVVHDENGSKRHSRHRSTNSSRRDGIESKKSATRTITKARSGYKATTKQDDEDAVGTERRVSSLARNREAAERSRQKRKHWVEELEAKAQESAAANAHLSAKVLALRDEVLNLKNECLKHTHCGCERIRQYLEQSVSSLGRLPKLVAPEATALFLRGSSSSITGQYSAHGL